MRIIRYNLILVISLITLTMFNACTSDDGYTLDNYKLDLATVKKIDSDSGTYYLTLDNGNTLLPIASDPYYEPKYDKRVVINYTLLSDEINTYDHAVKINAIQDILTKQIVELTPDNAEEIGNDYIKILDLWTGDHFLNIHIGYNMGGEKLHSINLVKNGSTTKDGSIVLELRHNTNGDPEKYGTKSYAAFDLKPFQNKDKNSIEIIVKVLDFNDEPKEFPITYKYK